MRENEQPINAKKAKKEEKKKRNPKKKVLVKINLTRIKTDQIPIHHQHNEFPISFWWWKKLSNTFVIVLLLAVQTLPPRAMVSLRVCHYVSSFSTSPSLEKKKKNSR
ncbi:hypothetical protein CEXT_534241 [Caerostris extrusa]|uniref:Uncharacterized protein n=1 Tax=Caerostris extrusa TaxID=172846 RepID=A0AAV4QN43_CAEEX|nr:hypothetical protein CEXT_534241 [Caerostris extrusa]